MSLRVIAGQAKGRKLKSVPGDTTRPITDRVKEALFNIIAGSMASVKFPGRAPEDKVLLRVFVGGALQPELNNLGDEELRRIVIQELAELIGLSGEPEFCDIARWLAMMPQYHVGHLELVNQIEARAARLPHFALAGNAYRGVGIPFCVRSGERAAERVLQTAATASSEP